MDQQTAQKQASEEMAKFQDETTITTSLEFDAWKTAIFAFHSPSSLKCAPREYFALLRKTGEYNLAELGMLIPAMENKSMRQLDMDFEEYEAYQLAIFEVALKFKSLIEKEGERINRKYQALMARSSESLSPSKKTLALSKTKGDA